MIDINLGQISKLPYLLADTVELTTWLKGYGVFSRSDLESLIKNGDVDIESLDVNPSSKSSAEEHDKIWESIEDCWLHLSYRQKAFDCYPFEILDGQLAIKDILSDKNKIYLFLVLCSRLRSFPDKQSQILAASEFELICREAMKNLLPSESVVRIFGANSDDRKNHYGTNLRDAIKQLANDLMEDYSEENINELSASGDYGLDIVGHYTFNDSANGSLACFGQCAAQEKRWIGKTLEAHPIRFKNLIHFIHDPTNIVFIPHCYRQSNGKWKVKSHTSGTILIDRLRICNLIIDYMLPVKFDYLFEDLSMVA